MAIDPAPHALQDGPAGALRAAIESVPRRPDRPAPDFSADGGVTLYDALGGRARLQPVGHRTRISLSEHDHLLAEGEVDIAGLAAAIRASSDPYAVVVLALAHENGPPHRPG